MTTTTTTARRTFYLRREVHVSVAGATEALCGMRLIGAIDTHAPASCADCANHPFEVDLALWAKVAPVADEGQVITGLPED